MSDASDESYSGSTLNGPVVKEMVDDIDERIVHPTIKPLSSCTMDVKACSFLLEVVAPCTLVLFLAIEVRDDVHEVARCSL